MAIVYDATGGNYAATSFSTAVSTSWTHTATGNFVIVGFSQYTNSTAPAGQTFSATYNGVAMTPLTRLDWDPAVSTNLFYMFNPPLGAQTVAIGASGAAQTGRSITGGSVSYKGVGGASVYSTLSGSGGVSTLSGLVASASDAFFIAAGAWGGQSANTYTQRQGVLNTTYPALNISLGDSPGTATSASSSPSNTPFTSWGILAVKLTPPNSFFGMF